MSIRALPSAWVGSASGSAALDSGWRSTLAAIALTMAALLALHWRTIESMVAIWVRSETFTHCFLIVPIVLVLLWMRRHELRSITPSPDLLGFVLLAAAGFAWLVGDAGQVLVVQQYAVTAMLPATVIALAGRHVAAAAAFPLAFLFFAVPVGEALIPLLMESTAALIVAALQITHVPVFREGLFITVPSGNWSVVEGCSGLRYLIASVTVGSLYAYLCYAGWRKRALFIFAAIAVPIVANGVRAYLIVMIAHLSNMRYALGVDHLVYGWLFFGLVMALLFWIGSFGRDIDAADRRAPVSGPRRTPGGTRAVAALAAVSLICAWPLYAWHAQGSAAAVAAVLRAPEGAGGWRADATALTDWRPRYGGASASAFEVYRNGDAAVALYLAYYRDQRQGSELVNSQNVMVLQKDPVWASTGESSISIDVGSSGLSLRETGLRSTRQHLVVWDWYRVSGVDLANPYLAKALLTRDKLLGRGDDGAVIVLASDARSPDVARDALRRFARDMLPSIHSSVSAAKTAMSR
jgi:exosortase A